MILAVGTALTVATALAASMDLGEALHLLALTGGAVAAVGAMGLMVLLRLRDAPLSHQVTAIALTGVAAVGAGVFATAKAMFLSSHDLSVTGVVILAAATLAALAATLLGARLRSAATDVGNLARSLGHPDPGSEPTERAPRSRELAQLRAELESARSRLAESREREQAVEASRRELVAWVSHDLRTPLAAIQAMAEALEDGVVTDPATVDQYHRTLGAEADRLAQLVDDLFELSRAQAGLLRHQLERVALADLLSDVIAGVTPIADHKGVRLEGRIDRALPDLLVSPPDVLRALRNILENAIRHTPSDGTVAVEAEVDDRWVVVSVRDSGGGIAGHDLDRVFDVAYRGDSARTPGHERGAGLGLAIARGMVEAHHGAVSVRNDGSGAVFTVRLPLATA